MADRTHQDLLMVTGTLDTTDIGGSPYAELAAVSHAFYQPEEVVLDLAGTDPVAILLEEPLSDAPAEEAKEAVQEPEEPTSPPAPKPASRRRGSTKKEQAAEPAES
ncbi:hypothetical protein [Streptomyces sp. NPDC059761]|uniref:hypothetical protein n=1 Tax=Streptomyces sp. NPDC059761 TaxID=3346937 RepID=UPI0036486E82